MIDYSQYMLQFNVINGSAIAVYILLGMGLAKASGISAWLCVPASLVLYAYAGLPSVMYYTLGPGIVSIEYMGLVFQEAAHRPELHKLTLFWASVAAMVWCSARSVGLIGKT